MNRMIDRLAFDFPDAVTLQKVGQIPITGSIRSTASNWLRIRSACQILFSNDE